MSAEEAQAFESRLGEDEDLAQHLQEVKALRAAARRQTMTEKRNMLADLEVTMASKDASPTVGGRVENIPAPAAKTVSLSSWRRWGAIAAVLLGGVLVYTFLMRQSDGPSAQYAAMFDDAWETQYIKHTVYRSTQPTIKDKDQARAYNLYAGRFFEDAIPFLEAEWNDHQDSLALYYLGISYLGIGKDEEGEAIMQRTADFARIHFSNKKDNPTWPKYR